MAFNTGLGIGIGIPFKNNNLGDNIPSGFSVLLLDDNSKVLTDEKDFILIENIK